MRHVRQIQLPPSGVCQDSYVEIEAAEALRIRLCGVAGEIALHPVPDIANAVAVACRLLAAGPRGRSMQCPTWAAGICAVVTVSRSPTARRWAGGDRGDAGPAGEALPRRR